MSILKRIYEKSSNKILKWICNKIGDGGNRTECFECIYQEKDYCPENPPFMCRFGGCVRNESN